MRLQSKQKIQGLSLIALLLATFIGTFIIIVLLQIFAANRSNFKLSQNLAEMNNVLRYVSLTMTQIVGQAGYRNPVSGVLPSYASTFPAFTGTLSGPSGNYNTGLTNANDPAGTVISYFPGETVFLNALDTDYKDMLWVKFQGDTTGKIRGCNDLYGNATTATKVRFYSRGTSLTGGTTGYYCEQQTNGTNYTYNTTPSGTELIPAELFDRAWVRYGEDLTGNGYIDRWSYGNDVQNRDRVYAVRFAFLIHSRDDVRQDDVTQTFSVFGDTITRTSKKIYKLYMFTVLLPNSPNYPLANTVATP